MSEIWYLAVCNTCTPLLPMPFLLEDERDRWAKEHTDGTGHDVLLVKQTKGETGKHIEQ